jgi:glycosyltransferase involved in cell wall biosynthesis
VIRLAAVIEALGRGGAERLLVDTARLLDRTRFELSVYTLFAARRDYAEALRVLEVPEVCLGLASLREIPRGVKALRAALREREIDVVHTHLFAANVVGRIAGRVERRAVVSTYHDADYEPVVRRGNRGLTAPKQAILRILDGATCLWSRTMVVAVSEYVAASVRRRLRVPPRRMTVVPNAVDTEVFAPDAGKREAARSALGLPSTALVGICVGRLTPQKGQDLLLNAFVEVRRTVPSSRLLLVGDGAHRAEYEELSRRLGLGDAVQFLGVRADVPELLRAADLLVLPSRHEGFGLVLAEAMACGTPVVAARIGPVPEIVDDGETGRLFAPEDTKGLAAAVRDLLVDPEMRRRLGARGRREAEARFSLPRMVSRLESLYAAVAGSVPR